MTKRNNGRPDGLFELPADAGVEPFEEGDLERHTNFQSRAPRSGPDFKAMALARLREAGADVERSRFEIDGLPVETKAGLYLASLSDDVWDVIGYREDLRGFRRLQGQRPARWARARRTVASTPGVN